MSSSSPTISENHTVASISDTEMDPCSHAPGTVGDVDVLCGMCRNLLHRPKELECLHMFCQGCIVAMNPNEGVRSIIVCPRCTHPTPLTSARDLRPASLMAKFITCNVDLSKQKCCNCDGKFQKSIKAYCYECNGSVCAFCYERHTATECLSHHSIVLIDQLPRENMKTMTRMCPKHNDPMKFYCRTCAEATCLECLQTTHSHANNTCCCYVEDEAETNIMYLQGNFLQLLNEKSAELRECHQNIERSLQNLHESSLAICDEIRQQYHLKKKALDESHNQMQANVEHLLQEKARELTMNKEKTSQLNTQVVALQQVFNLLPFASSEEIISRRPVIDEKIQTLTNAMPDMPCPQRYVLTFLPDQNQMNSMGTYSLFGQVTCGDYNPYRNNQHHGIIQQNMPPHQMNDAIANRANSNFWEGSQQYQYFDPPEENQYTQWSNGTDNVEHLQGLSNFESPNGVIPRGVSTAPLRSQLRRTKMTYAHRFGEYGSGESQFTEPSGVAVTSQNQIICADTNNHRIQAFDGVGNYMFQFGEAGKKENQLLYPNRVAIMPGTQDLVVTERSPTHQVQIFDQHGNFKRKFGANILQHPRGVCCDYENNIIIVECKVMRVIIFDCMGNVLSKFGCSRHLQFPNSVAVNNRREIFISDNRAHCVKVFSYGGEFLRQIGREGYTNYPIGVGIDSLGRVIVADNHNNFNVTIFSQDGRVLFAYESKVKHAQCYDVALMEQNSIVLASKDYKIYVYRWGE